MEHKNNGCNHSLEQQGHKVYPVLQVLKDHKVQQVFKVLQDQLDLQEVPVPLVHKVLLVLQELVVQVGLIQLKS